MLGVVTSWGWWLWPLGSLRAGWAQLYPNLLATVLCGAAVWLWGVRPHHRRVRASLADLHAKVDAMAPGPSGIQGPRDEVP